MLPHGAVGLAIVAGFAVMLVVDQVQGGSGHIRHVSRSDSEDELNDTERGLVPPERSRVLKVSADDSAGLIPYPSADVEARYVVQKHQDPGSRAFIGLLVHSLADGALLWPAQSSRTFVNLDACCSTRCRCLNESPAGVAVGTTGISDKEDLKLIVAFAMVLHKLPATFGLVTFLMASKWSAQSTRQALFAFTASAPLMALATYWLLVRRWLMLMHLDDLLIHIAHAAAACQKTSITSHVHHCRLPFRDCPAQWLWPSASASAGARSCMQQPCMCFRMLLRSMPCQTRRWRPFWLGVLSRWQYSSCLVGTTK